MKLALEMLLGAGVGFALVNVALGLLAAWSLRDDIWRSARDRREDE